MALDALGAINGLEDTLTRSPLTQITPANVAHLQRAWVFHTGDISVGADHEVKSSFESTPLLLDARLYLTSAFNRIIALDPATGRQLWSFDPKIDRTLSYGDGFTNRGLAAWSDPEAPPRSSCALRLFEATLDARLVAVSASTGLPCAGFGTQGQVDLKDVRHYHAGWYHMTSPPIVVADDHELSFARRAPRGTIVTVRFPVPG